MSEIRSREKQGHIYVLTSDKCDYVKIGGTVYVPCKRIPEIDATEPYKSRGPWKLHDFREVTDWRKVEAHLHQVFWSKRVRSIPGQRELFRVSAHDVSMRLQALDERTLVRKPLVDRMFQDREFVDYLTQLFRITGIMNWLELQGAWTFSLFPSTSGGRYFTLNIGRHEVAYSTVSKAADSPQHMIYVDKMIRELPGVRRWIHAHGGSFEDASYSSALDRSTSVYFRADMSTALEFLRLPGVRRAVIAYWTEALMQLQERGSKSLFARHHHVNAIAELRLKMLETPV